ncbi:DUF4329 domain-containing protein [Pseudomonas yamanorum]|nr:DUF4329 domain-containing protein [Pseudomonas yamanorum]
MAHDNTDPAFLKGVRMAIRLSREQRAAGSNRGAARLPALSDAFVHEADAAYWAHNKIGGRREREYGGVIVRGPTGLYRATEPLPGDDMQFNLLKVLALGDDGYYQQPKGYTCVASYHSHPAQHERIGQRNPSFDARMVKAFLGFFSGSDFSHDVDDRLFFQAAYLSGPDGSLIRYAPSGSPQERSFALWLRAGKPAGNKVGVYGPFSELVKKISTLGELSLIVPTDLWGGSMGVVPADWVVFEPFTSTAVTSQPLYTSICERAEDAIKAAQAESVITPEGRTFGFLLKHRNGEHYVATFPRAESTPLFSPKGTFPHKGDYEWALPANYALEAIYFRSSPSPTETSAREPWLYSTFIKPAELLAAISQERATRINQETSRGLQLYALVPDGALLKLKVPAVSAAGDLARQSPDGVLDDNGAEAELVAGTLTPRDYVRRVLAVTELSVVWRGALWRDVGPVDTRSPLLAAFPNATWNGHFRTAHDAAVYAHLQIGSRRGRYYGGYILKSEDGRFVATIPQESASNPFDGTLFFPLGDRGPLIPQVGYEVHGRYGSHPALSMVDPAWVEARGWTREAAMINLQVFSPEETASIIASQRPAYLSAGQDCLLAYTPGGPSWTGPFADPSLTPAQWVVRLAASGDLRVIEGNALWGPRAKIGSDWMPHATYSQPLGPPEYVTYGALFGTADAAARNLHARVHGSNRTTQDCFAFVLKHKDREQYIATEVVCVEGANTLFKLNSLFAVDGASGFRFPEGFVLHALFRSQHWQPTGLSTSSAWLTTYFVMPMVLYVAVYDSERRGRQYNKGTNLPVYLSTLDGALLCYLPAPIVIGQGGLVEAEFTQATALLASGQKTSLDFVREWAKRGQLRVVRTSQCWDKLGVVGETWSGYENLVRRRLSPSFANPDDAIRHVAAQVGPRLRRTYGGVVLRLVNGLFAATEPLVVPPRGFTTDWIYPNPSISMGLYPPGSTVVARYSSLVEREVPILLSASQKTLYTSMIPSAVLANLLFHEAHIGSEYVFGPNGSILSYGASQSAAELALKRALAARNLVRGDLADNQIEQDIREGRLLPSDFVTQVAKAGTLRVVEDSPMWGPARTLKGTFVPSVLRPGPLSIRATSADPRYSPIFTQAFDAVRHVHLQYRADTQVKFGYVFKSQKKPLYMATMPLVRENYAHLAQVFIDGLLPQGFRLEGFYLCAHDEPFTEPGDEMVYSFFSPQDIANALNFLKTSGNGRISALYLMCADGALLSYQLTAQKAVFGLMNKARSTRTRLLEGSLSGRDYILDLATKGELYIRVTSRIWGKKQRVTERWHPQLPPDSAISDPHFHSFCGPLFGHIDDAARSALSRVGAFAAKEYIGAVMAPPETAGYVALDPVEDADWGIGSPNSLDLLFWSDKQGFYVLPTHLLSTYSIVAIHAFYKTIASTVSREPIDQDLLQSFVSTHDLRRYVEVLQRNLPQAQSCYLSCRGGALLKYVPSFSTQETALLQPSLPPTPSKLVSQLRRVGQLSVLDTDAFWTHQGALGEEWQVEDVQHQPEDQDVLEHDEL